MRIGQLPLDNNVFLAPMAGITDLPYRLLMKRFGAGLVFSEMISANGLVRDGRRTRELLRSNPAERPLGVQLFGDDPSILAQAAAEIGDAGELLDLNMGCPVPKVVRSGAGSALLRDPQRIGRIVAAVRRAWPGPLTVKIRSGWDSASLNHREVARIAVAEGADAVTLHPRTRAQGFSGRADWNQLRLLSADLMVPVIGSGDIFSADDAQRMLAETGCRALMIGRGGYGNPWLLREILSQQQGVTAAPPTPEERLTVVREHLHLQIAHYGERRALPDMRKHLCWYARGLAGAAAFRCRVNQIEHLEPLLDLIESFFSAAMAEAVEHEQLSHSA